MTRGALGDEAFGAPLAVGGESGVAEGGETGVRALSALSLASWIVLVLPSATVTRRRRTAGAKIMPTAVSFAGPPELGCTPLATSGGSDAERPLAPAHWRLWLRR